MQHLVAKFDVKLPHYLIVNRAESDELSYNTRLDDFDIGLSLVPLLDRRRKSANKEHFSFLISRIIIKVSRMESLEPPPIRITEEGIKDYSPSQSYFEERLPKYKEAALAIANKTVRFFKYKLNHPLLREFNPSEDDFQNPEWFDELGQQFKHGITHLVLRAIPGLTTSPFGSKEFTDHYDSELQQALQMGVVADLREEIRSDAQTAIFEGNFAMTKG
ncbi:MAG: hypothetical protein HY070_00285 [Chloroflexi bacterium]|nr:hypothetical protein [Chloroflexota bacterium]